MSTYRIRRARVDDAAVVAALAAFTFTETFGDSYPPQDLQEFLEESYSVERQQVILGHADYAVWLLERDGTAVGHVAAGPCGLPHAEVVPGDGEIKRLYVIQAEQGGGWGSALLQTALDWLQQEGPRTLWLGVWSENLGAQRLYARHGFHKVGEYLFPVGEINDLEFILRRPASSASS